MNELLLSLMLLQVGLPILLIILNGVLPTSSVFTWLLRSGLIAWLIMYLVFVGLWLFPPWWTPHLLLLIHFYIVGISYRKIDRRKPQRRVLLSIEWLVIFIGFIGLSFVSVDVIRGRTAPATTINLAMPLEAGNYLVVNGGTTTSVNTHLAKLNSKRAAAYQGQRYAIDIIGINRFGFYSDAVAPTLPERYRIYGTKVLAPCSGKVVYLVDGVPNMPVPQMDREHMLGNGLTLACDDYYVVIGHLAPKSLQVQKNQFVQQGQPLGQVGNSGNTNGPHLHIHVQREFDITEPFAGEPEWFTIEGKFLLRNQRFKIDK